tara:strand:+ start:138 stop:479 length:342 start_codon:yes stop_codon:yes gene_type:complete
VAVYKKYRGVYLDVFVRSPVLIDIPLCEIDETLQPEDGVQLSVSSVDILFKFGKLVVNVVDFDLRCGVSESPYEVSSRITGHYINLMMVEVVLVLLVSFVYHGLHFRVADFVR